MKREMKYLQHVHARVRGYAGIMASSAAQGAGSARYTCSMHPDVVRDAPGSCPKCGMTLIPMP